MEPLQQIMMSKRYDVTSIISHHLNLSEGAKGYDIFANKKDKRTKVIMSI